MPRRDTRSDRVVLWISRDSLLNKGMASCGPNDFLEHVHDNDFVEADRLRAGFLVNDGVQIIELVDITADGTDGQSKVDAFREMPFMFPNRTIKTYSISNTLLANTDVFNPAVKGSSVWTSLSN